MQLTTAIKSQKLDFISRKVDSLTTPKAECEAYSCWQYQWFHVHIHIHCGGTEDLGSCSSHKWHIGKFKLRFHNCVMQSARLKVIAIGTQPSLHFTAYLWLSLQKAATREIFFSYLCEICFWSRMSAPRWKAKALPFLITSCPQLKLLRGSLLIKKITTIIILSVCTYNYIPLIPGGFPPTF